MPWVRFDDRYPENRKVKLLSDAAYRLDSEAIMWASANTTDGVIHADELRSIGKGHKPKHADELVKRGRWHLASADPCPSAQCPPAGSDGWVIHDYWDYQPSKEKVLREREAKAKRQAAWLAKKTASRDASHRASSDGSKDNAPPQPPSPPRNKGGTGERASPPARSPATPADKPPWCGKCDETTRQIETDDDNKPARCPDCHPNRKTNP